MKVDAISNEIAEHVWCKASIECSHTAFRNNMPKSINVATVAWTSIIRDCLFMAFVYCAKFLQRARSNDERTRKLHSEKIERMHE